MAAQRRSDGDIRCNRSACESDGRCRQNVAATALKLTSIFTGRSPAPVRNDHFLNDLQLSRRSLDPQSAACRAHRFDESTLSEYLARVNSEHRQILVAIRRSDTDGARATMRMHLSGSRDRLQQTIRRCADDRPGQHVRICRDDCVTRSGLPDRFKCGKLHSFETMAVENDGRLSRRHLASTIHALQQAPGRIEQRDS